MAGDLSNQIPESARTAVKQRARFRCERCGVPSPNGHWHHRRSRLVRDQHRHCPCNGVWLCATCHEWVHAHPFEAKERGFIMSKFVSEPGSIPTYRERWGVTYYSCDGGTTT